MEPPAPATVAASAAASPDRVEPPLVEKAAPSAAPLASPYVDVPKIDAPLSPERVLGAIISVLTQRGVIVKSYLERAEVEALNARNLARWRDRQQQLDATAATKEAKPKPEPMPPRPTEGDWWDAQVLLEGWTPRTITHLHAALDPVKLHQDTLLWWRQCVDEATGKPAFRYCFTAAPPMSVSELRDKVHRMFTYAYEVERPAVGNKLAELLARITRMERIVYYDAEGLLAEPQYEIDAQGDWQRKTGGEEEGAEKEEEEEEEEEEEDGEELCWPVSKERRVLLRQEARIRALEEQCTQLDELAKQVHTAQASLKQLAERLDASRASAAAAAATTGNGQAKKKHENLDPAQTRRAILRKKLEAQKRVQAEQEEQRKKSANAAKGETEEEEQAQEK